MPSVEHTGDPAPTASATAAGARSAVLCGRQRAPMSLPSACVLEADPLKVPVDPNGNLTTKTEGTDTWGYEWNARNELTRVTKNGVEQARFSYDPRGRRVEKVAGGVTISYTYDREDIIREVRGAATFKYVHGLGIDEPLSREDASGALSYYHADGLGSIAKHTNQAGTVVHEYRYDAWGNIEAGSDEPGFAFTSRESDPDVELAYYRARYYSPKDGRFTSEDPIGFGGGANFYAYVANSPQNLVDPWGLQYPIPVDTAGGCARRIYAKVRDNYCGPTGTPGAANPDDRSCRRAHCIASCLIARECPGGGFTAAAGGTLREIEDAARSARDRTSGGGSGDGYSQGDQCANRKGRCIAAGPGDCILRCWNAPQECPGS